MFKPLLRIVAISASIFAAALAPTAQAQQLTGVTDTEIHIAQWGPQTGPAAPWGAVARGTALLFQMVNDAGGIHGRKIVYHAFDDQYNPAKTVAGVKELVEQAPGIFAIGGGVGTSTGLAVKDYLMERGIPWVGPASGSLQWTNPPQKALFAMYPYYADEAKLLVRYLTDKEAKKKIAIFYASDEYGENGHRGAVAELTRLGIKPVAEVSVNQADRDLKSHLLKLKESGADAVLMWVNPTHAVITLKTAAALQFAPQWVTSSTLSDAVLMQQISGGLWKNIIYASFGELPDSNAPEVKKYRDVFPKYAQQGERWGVFFMAGIGFVEPLVEGLQRAGRNLTRESLIQAMETIKNYKGIMGRVSFGPGERQGQREVFLARTDDTGTKVTQLTPWMEAK